MDPRDIRELRKKAAADFRARKAKGKGPMPPPAPAPVPVRGLRQGTLRISESREERSPVLAGSATGGSFGSGGSSQEQIQRLLEIFDPNQSIGSRAGLSGEAACRAALEVVEQLIHFIDTAEASQEVALALEERTEEVEKSLSQAQAEAAAAKEALKEETERADELSARIKKSAFKVGAGEEALKKVRRERDEISRSVQSNSADTERLHQSAMAELRSEMEKNRTDAENHKKWLHDELTRILKINRTLREELDWTKEVRDQAMAEADAAKRVPNSEAEILRLNDALGRASQRNRELSKENALLKNRLEASETRSAERLHDNEKLASLYRNQEERLNIMESLAEARGIALGESRLELRLAREESDSIRGEAYRQGFEECRSIATMVCPERSKDFIQIPLNEPPLSSVDPSAATRGPSRRAP